MKPPEPANDADHPLDWDALRLSRAIHARDLSCEDLMRATLARIEALNPTLNALVSVAEPERLLAEARRCDAELAQGQSRGWLHGLPQAAKDTAHARGFATTCGSPLLVNDRPLEDSLVVGRARAAGALFVGKTNVPEFAIGSHTFNPVFGVTPNAWDGSRTAGGSSGGAAVALAHRLLPVADGSDFMGSLRNPAAWNHVFGLRPSFGRVPSWPAADTFLAQLSTDGPMARTVRDLAALLDVQAGFDPRCPLSLASEGRSFVPGPQASAQGVRVAWLGDLGGHLAMEDGVLAVCEAALQRLAGAGAVVEPAGLGFSLTALWEAWLVWRRALTSARVAPLLAKPGARAQIKAEALWECAQAEGLAFADLQRASQTRTAYCAHLAQLFERYDVLALPAAQVWPFDARERWPARVAGREMDTYHRWMEVTLYATFGGLPAISVPAGFHPQQPWPMGLQLIGRPRGDAELLQVAAAYEAASAALLARRPPPPDPQRPRLAPPA